MEGSMGFFANKRGKAISITLIALFAAGVILWSATAPPPYIRIHPPIEMGEVPQEVTDVQAEGDPLGELLAEMMDLPGHDEIVLQEDLGRAFVTCMDGKIWKVDFAANTAEPFVDPPLMAAGARQMPGDPDTIVFCASYLHGATYPEGEQVGIYKLSISTKQVAPLLTRAPVIPETCTIPGENTGAVYTGENFKALKIDKMTEQNSRALMFCNDLDVSRDGKRIYFSEPFAYEGASMGGGAVAEAISLGKNGMLWRLDLEDGSIGLVGRGYSFLDGVLLEYENGDRESSVLITETIKFRILRLHLEGAKAGKDRVLWKDLPGMPDGLDRDAQGRVWAGLLKRRSPLVNFIHANPWIKPLFLRIPPSMIPAGKETGIIAFSPDCSQALYATMHDGSLMNDVSVVVPGRDRIYLPRFDQESHGLYSMENPLN
jgi:hypothetical protein